MIIKYPLIYDTPTKKLAYLYRLYELVRVDGNLYGWNDKRNAWVDLIAVEINIQRVLIKKDISITANLNNIEGK